MQGLTNGGARPPTAKARPFAHNAGDGPEAGTGRSGAVTSLGGAALGTTVVAGATATATRRATLGLGCAGLVRRTVRAALAALTTLAALGGRVGGANVGGLLITRGARGTLATLPTAVGRGTATAAAAT